MHLLSIGRISFTEGLNNQRRWTSVIFSLCSMSGKSRRLNIQASNRSISNCRQFLIIYEEMRNVVFIRKATHVTSSGSIPYLSELIFMSFNFLRRTISLCKSFGWSIKSMYSVWIFEQNLCILCQFVQDCHCNPGLTAFKRPWHWRAERSRGMIEKELPFLPLPHPNPTPRTGRGWPILPTLGHKFLYTKQCVQICTQNVYKREPLDDECDSRQPWPQMTLDFYTTV